MEINFRSKNALVTGAGKGFGREICKALSKCGANVYALSRTKADLDSLVAEVPSIHPICVNLLNLEETKAALSQCQDIQLLVNNAGYLTSQSFLDITEGDYDMIMNINVKAVIVVSQMIAKSMVSGGKGGSIVNISSLASKIALRNHGVYCASKGALDQLTRVMALELGPHNIRTNAINPTAVDTDMGKKVTSNPVVRDMVLGKIPMNRFPEIKDVVNATLFLLSDKSDMINGVTLPIDGGHLAS